jgi:hypothetical protein
VKIVQRLGAPVPLDDVADAARAGDRDALRVAHTRVKAAVQRLLDDAPERRS